MASQPPPSESSPPGPPGAGGRGDWRGRRTHPALARAHDPEQASRLPPHTTLCYWAPTVEPELLERQVRHAFDRPISVRLGSVHEFGNADQTFYVEVLETAALDAARARLYDGTHLELPRRPTGPGTSPVCDTEGPRPGGAAPPGSREPHSLTPTGRSTLSPTWSYAATATSRSRSGASAAERGAQVRPGPARAGVR